MNPTKKTVHTWYQPFSDIPLSAVTGFSQERDLKVQEMIDLGQTLNPAAEMLSPIVYERYWSDQAAAEEFKLWLEEAAGRWNIPLSSVTIENI